MRVELLMGENVLVAELESLPVEARESFGKTVLALAKESANFIKQSKLSGQVLKPSPGRKKWHLRRSIRYKMLREKDSIGAVVGTSIGFYKVHEEGWSGQQDVKSFLRRVKGEKYYFGRGKKAGQVNASKTRSALQARKATVRVKAFKRHVTFPERSFIRTALADLTPRINQEMQRTLEELAK